MIMDGSKQLVVQHALVLPKTHGLAKLAAMQFAAGGCAGKFLFSMKASGLYLCLKLPLYLYYCCDYDGSAFIQRK